MCLVRLDTRYLIIGVASSIIAGWLIFIYSCSAQSMSFVFMVCEHEYMNIDLTTSLHLIVLKTIKLLYPLVHFNDCET